MKIPTYDKFIEPVLRVLQLFPERTSAKEVYDSAANLLQLNDDQRNELIASRQ